MNFFYLFDLPEQIVPEHPPENQLEHPLEPGHPPGLLHRLRPELVQLPERQPVPEHRLEPEHLLQYLVQLKLQ